MNDLNRIEAILTYKEFDEDGEIISQITRKVSGENAVCLPTMLEAYMYFLQSIGFHYVNEVSSGNHSSYDA